jgi:outer membrane protein OmpA-like peptidoglycan-associated protein
MKFFSFHVLFFIILIYSVNKRCFSQTNSGRENLLKNGDFEFGNEDFYSGFTYETQSLSPGQYSVTRFASSLNEDYVNPVHGDHTSGHGYYMIIDSDGEPGKKAWCATVNVIPNSNYHFSVYFCNLFKYKGTNSGFVINGMSGENHPLNNDPKIRFTVAGKQVGETEADIFHLYNWVSASTIWYSGNHSGPVDICIENLNYKKVGNDLALDDIEFSYIETMPPGYKPYKKTTIMVNVDEEPKIVKRKRIIQFKDLFHGDSIAPGIYTLHPSKKPTLPDTIYAKKGQKIQFNNLMFSQGKSDLAPEAESELNRLAEWMKSEPKMRIRVEGHTDNQGKRELNVKLSEDRVAKVKEYLVNRGISPDRIETIGFGGAFPVADNSKEETRRLNRRVEFEILKK